MTEKQFVDENTIKDIGMGICSGEDVLNAGLTISKIKKFLSKNKYDWWYSTANIGMFNWYKQPVNKLEENKTNE